MHEPRVTVSIAFSVRKGVTVERPLRVHCAGRPTRVVVLGYTTTTRACACPFARRGTWSCLTTRSAKTRLLTDPRRNKFLLKHHSAIFLPASHTFQPMKNHPSPKLRGIHARAGVCLQEVDITLPVSGEDGSLTVNNDIVIDTTAPYVTAVLSMREGVYTTGQMVDLQVRTRGDVRR